MAACIFNVGLVAWMLSKEELKHSWLLNARETRIDSYTTPWPDGVCYSFG